MNSPLISVVIPTHNRKTEISRSIDSVLDQSYPHIELIIVDDGSTDGTAEFIRHHYRNDLLTLIVQPNKGVSAARNVGGGQGSGEFVAFLDSDDQWEREKIEKQVAFHQSHPDIHISQTRETWIRNGKQVKFCKKYKKPEGYIFSDSLELCTVSPSSVFMTRSLFETYGGFDESMPACEDFELWLRISRTEKVGLVDESLLIKYGGHPDQLSSAYPAMDRYRIYALLKTYLTEPLSRQQKIEVEQVIRKKTDILQTGASKRNRDISSITELVSRGLNGEISPQLFFSRATETLLNEDLFS